MMMELMGLHIPGAAFVPPNTPLRQAVTRAAVHRLAAIGRKGNDYRPLARVVDEKAIVNACVGLLATGGSTNHAIHIPAMARAAGIILDWEDLDALSAAVPLIAHVYPNGAADVNHFHAAGGMGYVIRELLGAGLVHADVLTIAEGGMADYGREPFLDDGGEEEEKILSPREGGDLGPDGTTVQPGRTRSPPARGLSYRAAPAQSGDEAILRPVGSPFMPDGGMRLVQGNLGRGTFKTSAVDPSRWTIEAPARIFETQEAGARAFAAGELDRDVVVVVRFQGPRANGMPELHKLTPPLGVLQDRGHRVALVTDGRMSGASGKVPAAIHITPEALGAQDGAPSPLALLRDGDVVRLSAETGTIDVVADLSGREPVQPSESLSGMGRELFALFRHHAGGAEQGASAMLEEAGL
jgi:phosphogluconate dehydratase